MPRQNGLWIAIGGGLLSDQIESAIQTRWEFSFPVPVSDVRPSPIELVIISLRGTTAAYLGLSRLGRAVSTGQVTLMISNLIPVRQLSKSEIAEALPVKFRRGFKPPSIGVYRPTPRLWEELQAVLVERTPATSARLDDLRTTLRTELSRRTRKTAGGLEVFERDAVACALQAWGGASIRKRVLRSAISPVARDAPFLTALRNVPMREDPQIIQDQAAFPGMILDNRDVISTVVLTDGSDRLTILNCNRQPLEQTLGVDLIYYSHRFASFVMVQYKRMAEEEGIVGYRPQSDASHKGEITRMRRAEKVLRAIPLEKGPNTDAYRLSGRPFFIKLCETRASVALDSGMVSGMYVPLELWEDLLKSPAVVGPRGGIRITWENCVRRFSNGEFANLLRHGWIGSASSHTAKLSEIIEGVLASGRMLVLAATAPGRDSNDYRRDNWGRFASEDDPEGTF